MSNIEPTDCHRAAWRIAVNAGETTLGLAEWIASPGEAAPHPKRYRVTGAVQTRSTFDRVFKVSNEDEAYTKALNWAKHANWGRSAAVSYIAIESIEEEG